ncbi:MAG: transglycosylase SLT domain-containing protein [Balneolaceae bacterium]
MTHADPLQIGRSHIYLLMLLVLFFLGSCTGNSDQRESRAGNEEEPLAIPDPVERDFEEVKQSGVLRMITHYSSNTYFLHQGMEVGFEYELVRAFAREHDLALEVVIIDGDQNPFELLNRGEGDLIAANYAVNDDRSKIASFSRPYNLVDQMIVFSKQLEDIPSSLDELVERQIPITVGRNSSYYPTLKALQDQGVPLNIDLVNEGVDTESLLFQVAEGPYVATVSDDNMFHAADRYLDGLLPGPVIAENDTIAWATRRNAPDLLDRMNRFLYQHFRFTADSERPRRSELLNILRNRYFVTGPQLAEYYNPGALYQTTGLISPYDDLVQSVADSLDLDWLMLTAMIAQESRFNPSSESWAGAVGLMQIIPRFSDVELDDLYLPESNIREGARILREHLDHYAYLDSLNQWSFALATYNAGLGHMADARRLVIDRNGNPNEWEEVAEAFMMLMQRRHYQDARYGFARGIETVRYVEEIMNRYQTYQRIVTIAESREGVRYPGILGAGLMVSP